MIDWDRAMLPYKQAADELKAKFDNVALQYEHLQGSSPIFSVEVRVKRLSSLLAKIRRKNIPMQDFHKVVNDIAGIRIICRFVDDIQRIVDIIHSRVDMNVVEAHDYISTMKPSGYRSYHLIIRYPVITALGEEVVRCEVQIRTLAMNFWAATEHSLRYKYKGNLPQEVHSRLLEAADAAFTLDKEINAIKTDILHAEKLHAERIRDEIDKDVGDL